MHYAYRKEAEEAKSFARKFIYFIVCIIIVKRGVSLFTDASFYGCGLTCQQIEPTSR